MRWDDTSKARVRARYEAGDTFAAIAAEFGVTELAIKQLVRRCHFKRLPLLIEVICPNCKKAVSYSARAKRKRIFCSVECSRDIKKRPMFSCQACGAQHRMRKRGANMFCSQICAGRGTKKYSDDLIAKIRAAWMAGESSKIIASEVGLSVHTLHGIADRNDFPPQRVVLARLKRQVAA